MQGKTRDNLGYWTIVDFARCEYLKIDDIEVLNSGRKQKKVFNVWRSLYTLYNLENVFVFFYNYHLMFFQFILMESMLVVFLINKWKFEINKIISRKKQKQMQVASNLSTYLNIFNV